SEPEIHPHFDRHDHLSSAEISTERRPYIQIPVISGVATPIKFGAGTTFNQEPGQEGEGWAGTGGIDVDGNDVIFELDHQVPSHEVLKELYLNKGHNLVIEQSKLEGDDSVLHKMSQSERQDESRSEEAVQVGDVSSRSAFQNNPTQQQHPIREQVQNRIVAKEMMDTDARELQSESKSETENPQNASLLDLESSSCSVPSRNEGTLESSPQKMNELIYHKLKAVKVIWAPSSLPSSLSSPFEQGKLEKPLRLGLVPEAEFGVEIEVEVKVDEVKKDQNMEKIKSVLVLDPKALSSSTTVKTTEQLIDEQDHDTECSPEGSKKREDIVVAVQEPEAKQEDEAILQDVAAQLLDRYHADAHKKGQQRVEGKEVEVVAEDYSPKVVVNKLNKNHENFDKQSDRVDIDVEASTPNNPSFNDPGTADMEEAASSGSWSATRSRGDRTKSKSEPLFASEDKGNSDGSEDSKQEEAEAAPDSASPSVPGPAMMPDSLRTRGLVPSVIGAHHCTPQFCVNVSLSEDARFATFHIERPIAETGWISLGIGYAMTMTDLLIFWPNPTSEDGGGLRGAILSRRASHAYVEPHLVSGRWTSGDDPSEASLYPLNEYVLHNANPGTSITAHKIFPDTSKFVVQFTRPVRTKNLDYKLTPGQEQDFCWAYSPKPISPDSVANPGAHISQHLSVGSFAMDVGVNQPHLKGAILKQKEDEKLDAEKEREKELEESDRKLEDDGNNRGGQHIIVKHHSAKPSEAMGWLVGSRRSDDGECGISLQALQGFSCLVAIASMFLFR
ncbi:hypothetical protein BGZ65_003780, partial [Modicella reniformis]